MLEINFDLSSFEEVEIVPIADVHIGNQLCNESLLKETIDYILTEPENEKCARICLLNGDLCETVTRQSLGDPFSQVYSPQTQVALMTKYLHPLTITSEKYPNGKILSYCAGNHDHQRQYKDSGISAATSIACNLGLEDRFSTEGCYSFIKLRRIYSTRDKLIYTVYNQHMTGGGSSVGSKANRVAKITNGLVADLVVGSHVHTPITFKEDIILPQPHTQRLVQHTVTYVVTNAFLSYGDYAQKAGMKPSSISVPRIFMRQERHYINENKKRIKDCRIKKIEVLL